MTLSDVPKSNEKDMFLGYVEVILPNDMRIIVNQLKDPYKPSSILECEVFFHCCSSEVVLEWLTGHGAASQGLGVL